MNHFTLYTLQRIRTNFLYFQIKYKDEAEEVHKIKQLASVYPVHYYKPKILIQSDIMLWERKQYEKDDNVGDYSHKQKDIQL